MVAFSVCFGLPLADYDVGSLSWLVIKVVMYLPGDEQILKSFSTRQLYSKLGRVPGKKDITKAVDCHVSLCADSFSSVCEYIVGSSVADGKLAST